MLEVFGQIRASTMNSICALNHFLSSGFKCFRMSYSAYPSQLKPRRCLCSSRRFSPFMSASGSLFSLSASSSSVLCAWIIHKYWQNQHSLYTDLNPDYVMPYFLRFLVWMSLWYCSIIFDMSHEFVQPFCFDFFNHIVVVEDTWQIIRLFPTKFIKNFINLRLNL